MGDRANVYSVDQSDRTKGVYLYTHWCGEELPFIVQGALLRRQRWSDGSYLNRIIFSEMIKDSVTDETGYGIGANMGDNGRPIIVVDVANQTIGFAEEGKEPETYDSWSFEHYAVADKGDIQRAYKQH